MVESLSARVFFPRCRRSRCSSLNLSELFHALIIRVQFCRLVIGSQVFSSDVKPSHLTQYSLWVPILRSSTIASTVKSPSSTSEVGFRRVSCTFDMARSFWASSLERRTRIRKQLDHKESCANWFIQLATTNHRRQICQRKAREPMEETMEAQSTRAQSGVGAQLTRLSLSRASVQ
ncbi:hypothetical protein RvY_10369-1 [Ramazzottius varieornatus]|uniref:Uncharacterized protein n=1 Tax=Ramazzottius varieornatus TaxID=947166 RepID=A0A1D1VCI3_RAMVA|nr:hypothetical protein RvY_10369-1 [Ramazzottius varieornatus]